MTEKTTKTAGLTIRPEISKVKGATGRILSYTAKIGEIEGSGDSAAAAVQNLRSRLSETAGMAPAIRSTSDGAVWVLHAVYGSWQYRICRPDGRGHVDGGSCGAWKTRHEAERAMELHREQYQADLDGMIVSSIPAE